MSLLTIAQDVCGQLGFAIPTAVIGSGDRNLQQMHRLSNIDGREIASRIRWQALIRESSFLTKAQEDQGAIDALAGPAFSSVVNDTLWLTSSNSPILGSVAAGKWQMAKGNKWWGPYFRIRGNRLLFTPAPAAGQQVLFEWHSKAWVTSADGASYRTSWQSDDDVSLLDEGLMVLGMLWRWKKERGLEYAEDFRAYEDAFADLSTRDVPASVISADTGLPVFSPYAYRSYITITAPTETVPPTTGGDTGTGGGTGGGTTLPAGTLYSDFSVAMTTDEPAQLTPNSIATLAMLQAAFASIASQG